jgi:type II secretory pathway pseudopilin PulG
MQNAADGTGNARRGRRAFTLLEMLVVSGMILLLAGLLVAAGAELRKQALVKETTSRIRAIEAALQDYYGSYRTYPPVGALEKYISISNIDAWGKRLSYDWADAGPNPSLHNPNFVDLYSWGPNAKDQNGDNEGVDADGEENDDINNWSGNRNP